MRRILVVRTDRMGDVVLATPLLRALRRTFPEAFLAALVRPYARDLLLRNPHLSELLVDDAAGVHGGRAGFRRLVREIRARRFDTALLLLPTRRAAYALFWAGIPRRIGVGRKPYEVLTLMQSVSRNKYIPLRHEADYCLDLGRKIGVSAGCSPADLAAELFVTPDERAAAQARLAARGAASGDVLIGIHPASGGSSPNWEPARYVQLAARLLELAPERTRIMVTGEEGAPAFPDSARVIDLRGKRPLRGLLAELSSLHVLVSASTGPMHAAAALGVPTVSLFCPLPACSPQLWGPQGNTARIVMPPDGCCPGRCPRDPKDCRFQEISVETVARAVLGAVPA